MRNSFFEEVILQRIARAQADLLFVSPEKGREVVESLLSMEPSDTRVGHAAQEILSLEDTLEMRLALQRLQRKIEGIPEPSADSLMPANQRSESEGSIATKEATEASGPQEVTAVQGVTNAAETLSAESSTEAVEAEAIEAEAAEATSNAAIADLLECWSPEELAGIIGSSQATVKRWSSGGSPSAFNQKKLELLSAALQRLGQEGGRRWVSRHADEIAEWKKGPLPPSLELTKAAG